MPFVTETTITEIVLERWMGVPDPRLRQIMQSILRTYMLSFERSSRRKRNG